MCIMLLFYINANRETICASERLVSKTGFLSLLLIFTLWKISRGFTEKPLTCEWKFNIIFYEL